MNVNQYAFLAGLLMFVQQPAGASESVSMDDGAADVIVPGEVETGGDLPPVGEDGGPQRVDILVAYTPAARAYAGSTNAMKAAINGYIEATNDCYENSDIQVVLKLAGAVEVAYAESTSFNTDLSRLQSSSDSYLTTVPSLRNTYQADFVSLIRRNAAGGIAGLAYIGNGNSNFAPYAYSVVADIWALGNLSFPHELGHNYGCQHNRENANTTPVRSYAYGHKFTGSTNTLYCSVMSYQPGTRVPYFSNPSITYMGAATGIDGGATPADNARMIEEMAVPTAAFRHGGSRLGSAVVGDLNNDGSPDLLLTDSTTGERHLWAMSGAERLSSEVFATVDLAWRLVGTGDFNADQKTDIVWENTKTGGRVVWLMDGVTRLSSVTLQSASTTWRIGAVGDFSGDGKPDLVFENSGNGQRVCWLMNGTVRASSQTFTTLTPAWSISGTADLDADGKPDLVFTNPTTGGRAVWYMDGLTKLGAANLPTVAKEWVIVGVAEMNDDDQPDLVWENRSTKARSIWLMSGISRAGTLAIPTAP